MKLGIFAKIFVRNSLAETFAAVREAGFQHIQFNVETAGLPVLPDAITPSEAASIRAEIERAGIIVSSLSGTYNMIHPDLAVRARDFESFRVIATSAHAMNADLLTLCTGTRNTESMWRFHPGNNEPDAWTDLLASIEAALAVAEEFDLRLAFEPEPGNTINSSQKARRLLDEMQNPRLGVVIDAVNTMETQPDRPAADVLDEAFDLLSDDIFVAHAKDHDARGNECATGSGIVPWPRYVELLKQTTFKGPLIMHGLQESEVAASTEYLRSIV